MEPDNSSPHSQVPANCPYPEPDQSSHNSKLHFLKIRLNIVLPSIPGSPKWSRSLRFPYTPLLSSICATSPAHLLLHYLITRTILDEQYRSLSSSLYSFLHSPVTSSLLGPNISLNTLFSNTLSLLSSLNVRCHKLKVCKVKPNHCDSYNVLFIYGY